MILTMNKEQPTLIRISTAGSVDDGKSTLIGRLLHDSHQIYSDQMRAATSSAQKRGQGMEFAFLMDGLKAEREQGITIDVAYRYFRTSQRAFIIADTPGHEQYTRNMVTGASTADIAVILVDARKGLLKQSKRHTFIANLLGIKHMIVAVNKMDLVDWSQARFDELVSEFTEFAARLDIGDLRFVPISALHGDLVTKSSKNMTWYEGSPLLGLMESIYVGGDRNMVDLRFPVQWVCRPNQDYRGYAGQVVSGILRTGSEIMALPSGKTSKVASIDTYEGPIEEAYPPMSVTVCLEDELDISRGDFLVAPANRPKSGRLFEAMIVWMDEANLSKDSSYFIKMNTSLCKSRVVELSYRVDVESLHRQPAETLALNEIGRVVVATHIPIHYDAYSGNRATGCFILIDELNHHTVAAGMIIDRAPEDQLPVPVETWHELHDTPNEHKSLVESAARLKRMALAAKTIWITGLVGSGKRELAYQLEKALWEKGAIVSVLDGGKLRHTLSSGLDFSSDDTTEHLRRAAETAHLMNDAGVTVICAFVSPLTAQRELARQIIGADQFIEVHADVGVEQCEQTDRHGLYAKARSGLIKNLAGVNAPFERPKNAMRIDTTHQDDIDVFIQSLVAQLLQN